MFGQCINCGGTCHFYSLCHFPWFDEIMEDNAECARDEIEAAADPIVSSISEPIADGPIEAPINEPEFMLIVDDKLVIRFDDPFDPDTTTKLMPMIKLFPYTADRATPPPARGAQIKWPDDIILHHQMIEIRWWKLTDDDEGCDLGDELCTTKAIDAVQESPQV